MPVPAKIKALVARFEEHKEEYLCGKYNETQLRREFVDPFFKALGWDIDNEGGKAEASKDVIHEDAIRIAGVHKAPDYCMRIDGARKFFVEAKKPSVDIRSDAGPAYQIRRYAWSAKLPLSILTDFHEFAIYDCRIKPRSADGAAVARIAYYAYADYAEKWDEIAAIFSPQAIESGSFDTYAEKSRLKKGTEEVDDAFLEEIEAWRELLAKNIALRNPALSQRELNFAVQKTIDRIIFLRICEDRGVEEDMRLVRETNGPGIYGRLTKLFREADDRYDSGLFHFADEKDQAEAPDTISPDLAVDDDVLKKIIRSLYYPESPYAFSVFSGDILGQVYERFLGKVIRLTEGHHAKVEEKPEVRKAGGVYYTPTYIVDYIVKHTVGKLLEGKTPKQVAGLKILDPACGSGSFLLGAYQCLLDWHLTWYTEHEPKKWKKELTSTSNLSSGGGVSCFRLSTAERKRILLNNIFGVDIDAQAVEVTKLSLLLKVLEGETSQSIQQQFSGMRERVLPDLGKNIQCGNSLIGPDFYAGAQQSLLGLDDDERYRINVFDWETGFPEVFKRKNPGFDAVIGNPPYVLLQDLNQPEVFSYLSKKYQTARYKIDTYHVFIERGLLLMRQDGLMGYITPNSFLRNKHAKELRKFILQFSEIELLLLFYYSVFKGASVDTAVMITRRTDNPSANHMINILQSETPISIIDLQSCLQKSWLAHGENHFSLGSSSDAQLVIDHMQTNSLSLGEIATAYFGIQTFDREKFVNDVGGKNYVPVIDGGNISRYACTAPCSSLAPTP